MKITRQIETTHCHGAPKAMRLPAHDGVMETYATRAPGLMAVGAERGGNPSRGTMEVLTTITERDSHARSKCRQLGNRTCKNDHSELPECNGYDCASVERRNSKESCASNCHTSLGTDNEANAAAVAFSSPAWCSVCWQAQYTSATSFPNATGSNERLECARAHSWAAILEISLISRHLLSLGGGVCGMGCVFSTDQLRPDSMPVVWAQVPTHDNPARCLLDDYAEFRAWNPSVLAHGQLGEVNRRDPDRGCEVGNAASLKPVKILPESILFIDRTANLLGFCISNLASVNVIKTFKPLAFVPFGSKFSASINQCSLCAATLPDTFSNVVFNQFNANTCNAISVAINSCLWLNGPANFDMAVGEAADVEVVHLSRLLLRVWDHFLQSHQAFGEVADGLHAVNWNSVVTPLAYCAERDSATVGGEFGSTSNLFIEPFIEFHGVSLVKSKPHVKHFLNLFV